MTRTKSIYLALLAVLLSPMAANADFITTSAGNFEVTTVVATRFEIVSTLMEQVWWGDSGLASEFAGIIQASLGTDAGSLGPRFAYGMNVSFPDQPNVWVWCLAARCGTDTVQGFRANAPTAIAWAVATRVPEPGTLALLGIGLFGMGLARCKKV